MNINLYLTLLICGGILTAGAAMYLFKRKRGEKHEKA